jgi:hypothetical protein
MIPRGEVVDCRSHGLSPLVVGVAMIPRSNNYFDYAHTRRPISQLRLNQQLVGLRNSIRRCMGVSHRLVAERNNSAIFHARAVRHACGLVLIVAL